MVAWSAAAEPRAIGAYTDWTAFRDTENGKPICYVGSRPTSARGNYTRRGDTYVLAAIRPAESADPVVSIEAGYPYRADSKVRVDIDGERSFELFTNNRTYKGGDGKGDAWAVDEAADRALVEAMKAGRQMIVKGTSSRGTLTTDTYSLAGFTAAFNAMVDACKR